MAATCRHVGHCVRKNSRFLRVNLEHLRPNRNFGWTSALGQEVAEAKKDVENPIVIPRKKTWSNVAVLEALASTVKKDPTAYHYQFQDDTYLSPKSHVKHNVYVLAQESGRAAAKYFITNHPKYFTKDYAEPHIPCLMPENVSPLLEDVSEDALKERIHLRKVKAAVDMYDQLLQSGTVVSMETTHNLLDLICMYCDRDPNQEKESEVEEGEGEAEEVKKKGKRTPWSTDFVSVTWKTNNNAERIFNLLPEKDTRCYSALIRGMVKYGAYQKAFSLYTDLLNNRLAADIHIFNALILAAPKVREKYGEKWDLINDLLIQMNQQKIRPNLLTFNSILKSLRQCGIMGRNKAVPVLNEMKALGIAPSLATYNYILSIFPTHSPSGLRNYDILEKILADLKGTKLTSQDPDDCEFFCRAIRVCLDSKDLQQAYKLFSLTEFGENWRLIGNFTNQSVFYGRLFSLICMLENIDVIWSWYHKLSPSHFYPTATAMRDLMQALDTDSRLDMLPAVWKEIKILRHFNKFDVLEELLGLMARDTHSAEVQKSFALCALDLKDICMEHGSVWSSSALSDITTLLLRANMTDKAWEMLAVFKSQNRVPSEGLLESFLPIFRDSADSQRALGLVRISTEFCLASTPQLAAKILAGFDLTEEERATLSQFEIPEDNSN